MQLRVTVFIAAILLWAISVSAQSNFGNQKVQAGTTCPPVQQPLSGDGTLYTCTGSGALYNWLGATWNLISTGTSDISGTISATQVAFGSGADTIAGSANLTWTGSNLIDLLGLYQGSATPTPFMVNFNGYTGNDHLLATNYLTNTMATPNPAAYVAYGNFNASSSENIIIDPTIDDPTYNIYQGRLMQVTIPSTNSKIIYEVTGLSVNVTASGTSPNIIPIAVQGVTTLTNDTNNFTYGGYFMSELGANVYSSVGSSNYVRAFDAAEVTTFAAANYGIVSAFGTSHIPEGYGYYASVAKGGSGVIDHYYGLWVPEMAGIPTIGYSFWSDEQGVYRIRSDNTFNGVYQGIAALYNPQFTKYTAGAANFERCIPGCQWNSNVAEMGNEVGAGGGNVLRNLRFIGQDVIPNPTGFFYLHQSVVTSAPASGDCDAAGETNRVVYDSTNDNLYVCSGISGWRKIATAAP